MRKARTAARIACDTVSAAAPCVLLTWQNILYRGTMAYETPIMPKTTAPCKSVWAGACRHRRQRPKGSLTAQESEAPSRCSLQPPLATARLLAWQQSLQRPTTTPSAAARQNIFQSAHAALQKSTAAAHKVQPSVLCRLFAARIRLFVAVLEGPRLQPPPAGALQVVPLLLEPLRVRLPLLPRAGPLVAVARAERPPGVQPLRCIRQGVLLRLCLSVQQQQLLQRLLLRLLLRLSPRRRAARRGLCGERAQTLLRSAHHRGAVSHAA